MVYIKWNLNIILFKIYRLPKISLETKGIDCRQICLNRIQRTARFGSFTNHMSPSPLQNNIERTQTICGALYFGNETGFHDSRSCGEEGGVTDTTGGRDQLSSASIDRLVRD